MHLVRARPKGKSLAKEGEDVREVRCRGLRNVKRKNGFPCRGDGDAPTDPETKPHFTRYIISCYIG